ncbi:MAG TPA: cation-efflux pump, partial [Anaerolineales bacterium]
DREKRLVALSSVLAAIFLTSMKIVVGLLTGSLGILSEAAHSGLDLVAAAVTFFAVRISGLPPDPDHTYGHGKVENLSALFETILLLLTTLWIIYEAIQRLFFKHVEVETSVWAFVVMGVSIAIDFTRSRALGRIAKKYESQALEADALHFSTDIWSSSVVIGGLALVWIAQRLGWVWLARSDALAALGVAFIVMFVSMRLGRKTIADLLDAIPPGLREDVMGAAQRVPGVVEVKRARVRRSGPEIFADLTLTVEPDAPFEQAHAIAGRAEAAVLQIIPGADVMVNAFPAASNHEDLLTNIRLTAARNDLGVHGIRVYDVMGQRSLEMHVEVDEGLSLEQAHRQVTAFEEALRGELPGIAQIVTHIEPAGEASATLQATPINEQQVRQVLETLPAEIGIPCSPHEVNIHQAEGEVALSFHCDFAPGMAITDAHELTVRLEQALRARLPELGRVVIHVEPDTPTSSTSPFSSPKGEKKGNVI